MSEFSYKTWKVFFRRKVEKRVVKMPRSEQILFANLVEDLCLKGPFRVEWPNFGKLSEHHYHCHLSRSWVACWKLGNEMEIEVYYAGSREDAPYAR